jgi:hypothetical protein
LSPVIDPRVTVNHGIPTYAGIAGNLGPTSDLRPVDDARFTENLRTFEYSGFRTYKCRSGDGRRVGNPASTIYMTMSRNGTTAIAKVMGRVFGGPPPRLIAFENGGKVINGIAH